MSLLALLIFAGALAGHAALAVSTLNVLYGHAYPRRLLRGFRMLHDLWLVVGTPWIAWLCWDAGLFTTGRWSALPLPLRTYLGVCAVVGWVAVPAALIVRWLRRPPAAQLSNHGRTLDIAALAGGRPIGPGPKRYLARLPWNEQFQLEILEKTFRLPGVPAAWDGLSIVQLSDLHFTGTVAIEYFERVVDAANELDADLVAVTGDLLDRPGCYEWVPRVLGRLRSRWGRFAVLGNHDLWYDHRRMRRDMSAAGFCLVSGRWELAEIRGHRLAVAGTEAPWVPDLDAIAAPPAQAFRLLLSHTPDNAPWASRHGFHLMLAGHNHGGQVRLPVVGPVFMPSRYGRTFDTGAFQLGPTLLYVNRGLSGKHPLRFRCKPELTKIVLRSAE
jgi:predicted MPP superfamily phosphohydrolase